MVRLVCVRSSPPFPLPSEKKIEIRIWHLKPFGGFQTRDVIKRMFCWMIDTASVIENRISILAAWGYQALTSLPNLWKKPISEILSQPLLLVFLIQKQLIFVANLLYPRPYVLYNLDKLFNTFSQGIIRYLPLLLLTWYIISDFQQKIARRDKRQTSPMEETKPLSEPDWVTVEVLEWSEQGT